MDPLTEGGLIAWREAMERLAQNMEDMEVFSFRDMAALFAMVANEILLLNANQPLSSPESMAVGAYEVADALLKERNRQND